MVDRLRRARSLLKRGLRQATRQDWSHERTQFQIKDTGRRFGMTGKPIVKFNYLYTAPEWYNDENYPFHFENLFCRLGLLDHYDFCVSDDPDFVFISVYDYESRGLQALKHYSSRALYRLLDAEGFDPHDYAFPRTSGPYQRIFFTIENVKPVMNQCDWAFGFDYEEDIGHPNYMRLPVYLFCAPEETLRSLCGTGDRPARIVQPPTPGRRFCAFLHSHDVPVRNELFDRLSEYKRVDSPGLSRNNMRRPSYLDNDYMGGFGEPKLTFLKNYKFVLACENELSPGYTTEKLIQPVLAGSVPIYYGNKFVERDFNTKAFISLSANEWSLPKRKRLSLLIDKVKKADNSDHIYQRYLREPLFNSIQYHSISKERILRQFRRIFSSA